jgi:hypothetical protein
VIVWTALRRPGCVPPGGDTTAGGAALRRRLRLPLRRLTPGNAGDGYALAYRAGAQPPAWNAPLTPHRQGPQRAAAMPALPLGAYIVDSRQPVQGSRAVSSRTCSTQVWNANNAYGRCFCGCGICQRGSPDEHPLHHRAAAQKRFFANATRFPRRYWPAPRSTNCVAWRASRSTRGRRPRCQLLGGRRCRGGLQYL